MRILDLGSALNDINKLGFNKLEFKKINGYDSQTKRNSFDYWPYRFG